MTCEAALAGVAMDEAKMRRPQWPPSPPWGVVKRLGARAGVGDLMCCFIASACIQSKKGLLDVGTWANHTLPGCGRELKRQARKS